MTIVQRMKDSVAPYLFLTRNAFLTALSFRLRTALYFTSAAIEILVQVFLWRALFSAGADRSGVTFHDTMSYLVSNSLLRPFFRMRVGERLAAGIYDGSIATDLLKPLRLKLTYAAHEAGGSLADLLLQALPPAVVWGLILRVQGPASPVALAAAALALALGLLLNYEVEIIVGQLAFWLQDIWYLHWFHRALIVVFSGAFVPLWFYPSALRRLAEALPFRFTAFVPISLYLGKTPSSSLPELAAYALVWLLILGLLERLVWVRGMQRIVVHGG